MAIGWNFPSNNNGDENGIGEAGIETFKGSLFSSLAREICQNSLDARNDENKPVKVEFSLYNIENNHIPGFDSLTEAIELCYDYWKENKKTRDFFTNAKRIIRSHNISILKISDYNTTGLTGSDKERSSPWQDLVKSSGVSNKNGALGGSFGIGKSAPFACSDLRTIFYSTLDIDGLKAYQGVAKLVSFKYPDKLLSIKKGDVTVGKGYYGETSNNSAVSNILSLGTAPRTEIGTDVFVVGFAKHTDWKDEITKAVIDGYLISIIQNDLEVSVDNIVINKDTIDELIHTYKEQIPLAYNYYEVLTDESAISITDDYIFIHYSYGIDQLTLFDDIEEKGTSSQLESLKMFFDNFKSNVGEVRLISEQRLIREVHNERRDERRVVESIDELPNKLMHLITNSSNEQP